VTTHFPPPSPAGTGIEHRGWKLETTWSRSSLGLSEGWICHATRPMGSHRVNIGRWADSEVALEQGRAYVDRRIDAPASAGSNLAVQKRRQ
jgi:hypothetical protein